MAASIVGTCPHCGDHFLVLRAEINCAVFRHGAHKNTGEPINPHASLAECEDLLRRELIYGCGKPFRLDPTTTQATACSYAT